MKKKRPVQGGGLVGGVFGLVLGASAGFHGQSSWGADGGFPVLPLALGVVFGVLGFFFGDRFWRWFSEKAWFL